MEHSSMEGNWLTDQYQMLYRLREMKSRAATSDSARYYAVTITELEKVIAYFETWVIPGTISKEAGSG